MRFISMTRRPGVAQPGRLKTSIPSAGQVGRRLRQICSSAPVEAALEHVSWQPRSWSSLIFSRACRLPSCLLLPADHWLAGRSGQLWPVYRTPRLQLVRSARPPYPRQPAPAHPLLVPAQAIIPHHLWMVIDSGRDIAELRIACPMAPFAENDEILVSPGYATEIRPQARAKKISFIARNCGAALEIVVEVEAVIRLVLLCLAQLRQITAQQSIPVQGKALPPELRSSQPVMSQCHLA